MPQAQDRQPKKLWQTRYFWLSITPLLITLSAFALINILTPAEETIVVNNNAPTAVSALSTKVTPTVNNTPAPILPATILPTAVPTITPRPELDDTATITLLGPPPEAMLPENSQLAFYWRLSQPLPPGQQFVLTLRQSEITVTSKPIEQPNLGDGYQFLLDLADSSFASGTIFWQIQLQWADGQQPLLSSEERTLVLVPE